MVWTHLEIQGTVIDHRYDENPERNQPVGVESGGLDSYGRLVRGPPDRDAAVASEEDAGLSLVPPYIPHTAY